jgi:hypothetical protein
MIPEPITTEASSAEPRNSPASSRGETARGAGGALGRAAATC